MVEIRAMMGLKSLLQTSYCIVLGYPQDSSGDKTVGYPRESLKNPNGGLSQMEVSVHKCPSGFQMPLHYPRYKKADYEKMEEWRVDKLLNDYGLSSKGTLAEKRGYAMGAFLWPDQL